MAYSFLLLLLVADSEEQCPVTVVEGFLKRHCEATEIFQCMGSDQKFSMFRSYSNRRLNWGVDGVCPGEVGWYQACGILRPLGYTRQFTTDVLPVAPYCGYLCSLQGEEDLAVVQDSPCQGKRSEVEPIEVYGLTVDVVPNSTCNGVCDNTWDIKGQGITNNWCYDEVVCGGLQYGVDILSDTENSYFPLFILPWQGSETNLKNFFDSDYYDDLEWIEIVESSDWCEKSPGEEEDGDSTIGAKVNQYPLFNGSRCFPFEFANALFGFTGQPYCKNGFDQTNCSDPARVAGKCLIRGYPSTVSTLMTCLPGIPGVCDDGIDLKCVQISPFCRVHRHKLCDNITNCPLSLDETIPLCDNLSKKSCIRPFGGSNSRIPFTWVRDGVMDCDNGEDEADGWSSCGDGSTFRYSESECLEVFICRGIGTFKELEKVCDASMDRCEKERSTCEKSIEVLKTFNTLLRLQSKIFEPICLPGLEGYREMVGYRCLTIQLSERKFYGETNSTGVLSMKYRSCRNLFGETYVLMSCLGLCDDATCRIVDAVLSHQKCPNIQRKVYALDSTGSLTFAVQDHGRFHNDFFLCENKLCVPFEHVCNLRDNCGDGSDEKNCSNNFRCEDGRRSRTKMRR
eukprot:sb/3463027/